MHLVLLLMRSSMRACVSKFKEYGRNNSGDGRYGLSRAQVK